MDQVKKDFSIKHLDAQTDVLKNIQGKKILNIGGSFMAEMSQRGAEVVAIHVKDDFSEEYNLDNCQVMKYNMCQYTTEENLMNLGTFDIICFFELIHHLDYEKNQSILNYIYEATDCALSSSDITPYENRKLNWDLDLDSVNELVLSTGYRHIDVLILDEKKIGELVNSYYFRMLK
tara:strand:+ start:250 stop:777 length:528 start_codon:yes stop_codon:yes gene_type:complete